MRSQRQVGIKEYEQQLMPLTWVCKSLGTTQAKSREKAAKSLQSTGERAGMGADRQAPLGVGAFLCLKVPGQPNV